MWEGFIEYIIREWNTLKSAPGVFLLCLALATGLAFVIIRWRYQAIVEILNQRLAAKDDQLTDYRERLHLTPTTDTSYSRMTNNELRQKALAVISQMRDFLKQQNERYTRLSNSQWQEMSAAKSEEEKRRIWNKYTDAIIQPFGEIRSDYEEKFKVDTILLRDELLSRLPKDARDDESDFMYEYPINLNIMAKVAADLERLSKSLP